MTIEVFVILWFCREDDPKLPAEKVGQAHLYPIGAVTLGVLFALSGIGNRALLLA